LFLLFAASLLVFCFYCFVLFGRVKVLIHLKREKRRK
jgi:hypothetical protein